MARSHVVGGTAIGTVSVLCLASAWADVYYTPGSFNPSYPTTSYSIYVPPDVSVVRGAIFFYAGSGGDWRSRVMQNEWQQAARALGFALIGTHGNDQQIWGAGQAKATLLLNEALSAAATASGHRELVNVPIISTGYSAGGYCSTSWADYLPERTLAAVPMRGGVYFGTSGNTTADHVSAVQNVNMMFIAGGLDTNPATRPNQLTRTYATWRGTSGTAVMPTGYPTNDSHASFAVDWGDGHNTIGNQTWPMAWTFIAQSIAARYPQGVSPSTIPDHPITLINQSQESGWLASRAYLTSTTGSDYSTFVDIAPYENYTGIKTDASWLPDETTARVYQAFNSYAGSLQSAVPRQGPLAIVGDAAPGTSILPDNPYAPTMAVWTVGTTHDMIIDPRGFDDVRPIATMEYYNGSQLLGVQTTPVEGLWKMPLTVTQTGIVSLTAVATDSAGNKTSAFRTVVVANPMPTQINHIHLYRFEASEPPCADFHRALNMTSFVPTGATFVMLPSTETQAGAHFPKQFKYGTNGYALQLASTIGNNQGLYHVDDTNLPSGNTAFTVEGFINLASGGADMTHWLMGHGVTSTTDCSWQLGVTKDTSGYGPRNLVFQTTADGKGQTSGSLETLDSNLQIAFDVDYYFAFAFNPSDTSANGARFYLKDLTHQGAMQEVAVAHGTTSLWNSVSAVQLGTWWNGLLDEMRLTNRMLSSDELLIHQVLIPEPASIVGLMAIGSVMWRVRRRN